MNGFSFFLSCALAYSLGGAAYPLMELGFRGRSHWSMSLAGGLGMLGIHWIGTALPSLPFLLRCILCGGWITAVELAVGCGVNLLGKQGVWDYSNQPLQLWGQICLPYSLLWMLLSAPALLISERIGELLK